MNDNEKTARALLWRADSLLTGPDGALLWATLEGLLDDLAAALERERVALWALALERMEGLPAGWARDLTRVDVPVLRHANGTIGRWMTPYSPGWWSCDGRPDRSHRTALAAILSIDPTAKPPSGWTP